MNHIDKLNPEFYRSVLPAVCWVAMLYAVVYFFG